MKKRILSVFLALVMVVSLLPMAVFADDVSAQTVDLDTFIEMLVEANYTYDGSLADGKKLTVKWKPVSGCFDSIHKPDHCVNTPATGNTPWRVNSGLAQFHLFKDKNFPVSVKNVDFVYEPDDFKICANSDWSNSYAASDVLSAQLYFRTTGDVTFENCGFDKVVLTTFYTTGTTTIRNCVFENVYDSYAIKDIRGENLIVTGTQIKNCGGGIMLSAVNASQTVENVDISDNVFENVDVAGTAREEKVGGRGLIQIADSGDYTNASITLDSNTAENCGPILWQFNQSVVEHDVLSKNLRGDLTGLGGVLTYTDKSIKNKTSGEAAVEPTVYTIKYAESDLADMKIAKDTTINLPAPTRSGDTFLGWSDGTQTYPADTEYTVTADVTLTAQWSKDSTSGDTDLPGFLPGFVFAGAGSQMQHFVDVTSMDYYFDAVNWAYEHGITGGTGKVTFSPDAPCTRAQTVTFLWRAMGSPRAEKAASFTDVKTDSYYADAVAWAVENGITKGTSATTFSPDAPCTRAQIVTLLYRAIGVESTVDAGFVDVPATAYYADAVDWATQYKITGGTGANRFSPDATCTRGQIVTFLYRAK